MSIARSQLILGSLSFFGGAGALAVLFYYLSIADIVGMPDVWAIDRVVAYLLMFVGPLLIFLPPSLALRLGPLPLVGAASWATLGYLFIFVAAPSREGASFLDYLLLAAAIFFSLSTLLTVPLSALGKRLLPPAANPTAETARAFREGALLAGTVVAIMVMSPVGVLNWLNAMLVVVIAILTEFFFLTRG